MRWFIYPTVVLVIFISMGIFTRPFNWYNLLESAAFGLFLFSIFGVLFYIVETHQKINQS